MDKEQKSLSPGKKHCDCFKTERDYLEQIEFLAQAGSLAHYRALYNQGFCPQLIADVTFLMGLHVMAMIEEKQREDNSTHFNSVHEMSDRIHARLKVLINRGEMETLGAKSQ